MAEKKPEKKKHARHVHRFHIRSKDRGYFTSNLALLLKAAVPVGEAMQSLQETSRSGQLKKALGQMRIDIDEGYSLWQTLDRSGVVSKQTLALIRLGEQSGNLTENLAVAARQEEKQRIFRSKVRSALLYPSFVLGMTAAVGLGVAWFLLPRLAETFAQLDVKLPWISQVLIGFGLTLRDHGIWLVPTAVSLVGLLGYMLFAAPRTSNLGRRLLFHIPGVSRLLYEVEVARFGYLLGTLLAAGLSVTQAFQLLHDATTAPRYKKFYNYLHQSFEEGYGFRASLPHYKHSYKLLPPAVQQMVIAGERSGALPETLVGIGDIYEERADVSTQNLETILEPILLVLVWVGVMGVAVAVILPIYSLVGGLEG